MQRSLRKANTKRVFDVILDRGVDSAHTGKNLVIFSTERVNIDSITPDITTYWGWMQDIEKMEMR